MLACTLENWDDRREIIMTCIEIKPYSDVYKDQVIHLTFKIGEEFNFPISLNDQPDLLMVSEFYQQGLGNFWIALNDEKVVGTIALIDIGNNQGAVRKVFVDSEYRGEEKKVSKSLLEALMNWCKQKNIHEIFLGTRSVFLAAHRFYEKNGFKEISREILPKAFPINMADSKFYVYQF